MLWWCIAAIVAFFVKGLCGFANTLVFTTMLSFQNSNVLISPVELILGYPSNIILAWKERKEIKWSICAPLSFLVILGSIPGIFFLKNVDAGGLKVFFGALIVFLAIEMFLREIRSQKVKQSKVILGIIGVVSGILCGLYGVGALLGAYVNRVTDNSRTFKANICIVFLVENTFRIIMYALWGIITVDICRQALLLFPCMLLGLGLGMLSSKVLNEGIVKRVVILMLFVSGIALIINNL